MSVDRVNYCVTPAAATGDWVPNTLLGAADACEVAQADGTIPGSPSGRIVDIVWPSTALGSSVVAKEWAALDAGVTYIIKVWAWCPEGSPDFYADVPFYSPHAELCTVKGDWASASVSYTPPSTAAYPIGVRIDPSSGGLLHYAGATVERADTPMVGSSYLDGDTPGASWDGTPGMSVSRMPVLSAFNITTPPRTLGEILAGSGPRISRADIITGPRAGESLPFTDCDLTVDLSADVRRTASMAVPGTPEWTPTGPTHTLDVRSRSELRLWQGVVDDAGEEHWWSQGVFLVAGSSVQDTAGGREVSVDLVDRSHRVKRAGIGRRWSADGKDYILASVAAVIAEVAPWVEINIDTTGDLTFGTDAVIAEWGDDVWVKCRGLARTLSRDLHFDRDGVLVAPPITDPLTATPAPLPSLVARSLNVDADDICNIVGCDWEEARPDDAGEGWEPKGGRELWTDTTSSTSVALFGPCRSVAGGDTSVVHTAAHAALAAQADGITRVGLQQAASGSKVPDPRDDVGVPVDVDGTTHIISRLGIDLTGQSATTVDMGASRPDIALMMAALTKPVGEYRTTEIVTGLSPLRARRVTDPGGAEVSVQWTDALAGVEVGDPITVSHKGAGLRVGVALLVKKPLVKKAAGEKAFKLAGGDVEIDDDLAIRARVGSSGSYGTGTMSGSTISIDLPGSATHTHTLPNPTIAAAVSMSSAQISESVHAAVDQFCRRELNRVQSDLADVVFLANQTRSAVAALAGEETGTNH